MRFSILAIVLAISLLTSGGVGYCLDEVRIPPNSSNLDKRTTYPQLLLTEAMKATEPTDGPFVITCCEHRMSRDRGMSELTSGNLINVYPASFHKKWATKALVVKIPIYKGLRSYRLLLINRNDLDRFAGVKTLEDLKTLRVGVGSQWPIVPAFEEKGLRVVTGSSYDGLFAMLDSNRFDYFPRGLGDIYTEVENRQKHFPNLFIEPRLAINCPLPIYFYVSPNNPELADRIRRGLEILIADGTYDAMFHERFDKTIDRAQLDKRRILFIHNPMLENEIHTLRDELWFRPKVSR